MASGNTYHIVPAPAVERAIRSTEETGPIEPEYLDPAEEEALRQLAMRITPSRAELEWLIEHLPPSSISYDDEEDELPC